MPYKFKLNLTYNLESDNEQDAIYELVDLIRRYWEYYADEGDLVEVKGKRKKTIMWPRSRLRDRLALSPELASLHREGQTYGAIKARVKKGVIPFR